MRRSRRLAKKPRKYYEEDFLWERAVRTAQKERVKIEKKKTKRKKKKLKAKPAEKPTEVIYDEHDEEEKVGELRAAYMPWEKPGWDPAQDAGEDWNTALEAPQQRVQRIMTAKKAKKPQPVFKAIPMGKAQRNLLFMNPGDKPIGEAIVALTRGGLMPEWSYNFRQYLYAKVGTLYFRDNRIDLPFALQQEKRDEVKSLYFNPKEPSTIQPITDELRGKFCNISKRNVTHILRSLETYQRNFGRRIPPKIASRTMLRQPGILAMDMFFPSTQLGWWGKFSCLTCMDTWSRFCRCYALEHKDYQSTSRAMTMFLQEFASFGFPPRRILADKGTDLAPAKVVMEKYESKRMDSETVGIAAGSAEAYDIDDVQWAMRLTYSGEFIHAAPWSVGSQGRANVSHGCTGMSTADAGWLYAMTRRGDVVETVGTQGDDMTLTNGYGDWNVSFQEYREGSAL